MAPRAKVKAYQIDIEGLEGLEFGGGGGLVSDYTFTATSGLVYTLPFLPASESNISVYSNGITVYPDDYSVINDQLTFVSGVVDAGYEIFVKGFQTTNTYPLDPAVEDFVALSGVVTYDIGFTPVSKDALLVVVNGIMAHPDMYSLGNTNELTFASGVIETDDEVVVHNIASCTTITGTPGTLTDFTFTAGSGEVAFALPVTPVSEVSLVVFVNGLAVHPDDYALSGAVVVFASDTIASGDVGYIKVVDPIIVGYDFEEAPLDGSAYIRMNGAWAPLYDIGATYVQYPDAANNSGEVAFPTAQEPTALYGGTWTAQWESEGIFFKTKGDALSQTNGENNERTTGLQTDAMQQITGTLELRNRSSGSSIIASESGAFTVAAGSSNVTMTTDSTSVTTRVVTFDSSTSTAAGGSRTGKETRPRNRLIRVWKRTS